jgi:hypothetical protein
MNKRQLGRAREVKPSYAVDLGLVKPYRMQEVKQLLSESCKSLEVYLLPIWEPWKIN